MPRFHVQLSALAFVTGTLDVIADSPEAVEDEVLKRTGEVLWSYQGLNGTPDLEEVKEEIPGQILQGPRS